ncbi:hypothetical protein SAMN05428977_10491 [Nitrosomonas sp. Nm166]|nr:hypothetical protein SAMN05428977_10491 [Nitrosomonas sp. Nm166]
MVLALPDNSSIKSLQCEQITILSKHKRKSDNEHSAQAPVEYSHDCIINY